MSSDSPTPPVARRVPHVHEAHGDRRPDDYHWLRDRDDPEVTAYLEAENAYADSVMEPLRRLRILTWTNPRRLPGVRCSVLKTVYSSLLNLMTMPGRSCVDEII